MLVPVGCRSDAGLSAPIIRRLDEHPKFECHVRDLYPADFQGSYHEVEDFMFKEFDYKNGLMLCVGDRIEMTAAACAAFHNHVKIAHVYAGVVSDPHATLDDRNRHCISIWADLCFCEDEEACEVVIKLWQRIGRFESYKVHNVGITHLDDLEVDESLVPNHDYVLILYNPILDKNLQEKEIRQLYADIFEHLEKKDYIWIGPNPDIKNSVEIQEWDLAHTNLPRAQFLGLLKNCQKFISNSSASYYEAPHFLKPEQIVLVGERNKNRSTPAKLETGASDKIVQILHEYFRDKYVWEEIVKKRKKGDFGA